MGFKFNPLTGQLDLVGSSAGGGGVTSLNTLTGDVNLVAGSNITLTPSGNDITIDSSGGGGGTTIGDPVSGGTNYASLSVDGSGNLANGFLLPDPSGVSSVDLGNRQLMNASDQASINYQSGFLYNTATGYYSIYWMNDQLIDSTTNIESINWRGRVAYDQSHTLSLDWLNRNASDAANSLSINWNTRILQGATAPVLAWDPSSTNAVGAFYWFDSASGSRITGDGSGLTGVVNAVNANYLYDTGGPPLLSASGTDRKLYDSSSNVSVDWTNRTTYASDGSTTVFSWGGTNPLTAAYWFDSSSGYRLTGDGSGLTGVVASTGIANYLYDTAGTPAVAANGITRKLYNSGGAATADWENIQLLRAAVPVVDWNLGQLSDSSNPLSIDWFSRILYRSSGIVSIDYASSLLKEHSGQTTVDWDGLSLSNASGQVCYDWQNGLINSGGSLAIDLSAKVLASGTVHTLSWGLTTLNEASGNNPVMDWSARACYTSVGVPAITWGTRQLTGGSGETSVDWGARGLVSGDGSTTVINWGGSPGSLGFFGAAVTTRPTSSGAQTAGAVYTSTEQTMLQQVYDAVRLLGLMA